MHGRSWRHITLRERYLAHVRGERPAPEFEVLRPLGWTWAALTQVRNRLYAQGWLTVHRPPMPVVSVGNLTFGGTGKTPWVSYLLEALDRPERVLGVLTRGYGASRDEAQLLAARHPEVPISIDPDRARGARELARRGVTLAIADDAFQHRRLHRVVDLLLIDTRHPFGNERVLPAGMLRETVESVARATAVVLTRSGEASAQERARIETRLRSWLPSERIYRSDLVVASWRELGRAGDWMTPAARLVDPVGNAAVIALCAIANPSSFHRTLRSRGLDVRHAIVHRDHHRFGSRDLHEIAESAARVGAGWIACTEKDLFNLPPDWRPPVPLLIPRLRVTVDRETDLRDLLEARFAAAR